MLAPLLLPKHNSLKILILLSSFFTNHWSSKHERNRRPSQSRDRTFFPPTQQSISGFHSCSTVVVVKLRVTSRSCARAVFLSNIFLNQHPASFMKIFASSSTMASPVVWHSISSKPSPNSTRWSVLPPSAVSGIMYRLLDKVGCSSFYPSPFTLPLRLHSIAVVLVSRLDKCQ